MTDYKELAQNWGKEYGISTVLYADEESGITPSDLGWDLDKVWTGWDSYDELGGHVVPGYEGLDTPANDQFVACWYLGSIAYSSESSSLVITLNRESCESCDTDGCDDCEGLGWIETNLLDGLGIKEVKKS